MLGLVDVTDPMFGAVGDGATDCRIPVQNAITFARTNNQAGIVFPAGDFKFSRANPVGAEGAIDITGVDGFTIAGAGAGTRLFQDVPPTQDWHLIRIFDTAECVTVRDLTLDGSYLGPQTHPGVTEQHHLIRIGAGSRNNTHTHQVRVTNCHLLNCRGDAINLIGGTSAVGVLTLTGNPSPNETVTIGTTRYKFVATLAAAFDVRIGATATASLDNLRAAILRDSPGTLEGVTYGAGTTANAGVGGATRETTSTLAVQSRIPEPLALAETLAQGNWNGITAPFVQALTDEVMIDHNYIYATHRSGIGVQRGCRKIVIDGNIIAPARRGVIHFEPTGSNVDTEDWAHGNAPQQFVITNNILVATAKGNTVASLSGIGARDRDKYSIFAHNLCLGGGFNGLNVGPLVIEGNIIVGNRRVGSGSVGLIRLWRGCQDVIVATNYLERPVPEEGETHATNTLEFRENAPDSAYQQPQANESVRIGPTTYTFRTSLASPNDVLIGGDLAQTCANLVAAILGDPGAGTVANPSVTAATTDGDSVSIVGDSVSTQTTDTLTAGFWSAGGTLANSAGPLIEVLENGGVQPIRVTIENNHGRQHTRSGGIVLTSVSDVMVRGNQLHCFHSGAAGNGISHRSITSADQVHIHGNHLMTQGSGRWNHGIHISDATKLGHSSVSDNSVHGARVGIRYESGPPQQVPAVIGNRVSGNIDAAYLLPSPTCNGGNLGGIAQFQGAGAPSIASVLGSTYLRTDGAAGVGGAPGTLRYLCLGGTTWVALVDQ